MKGKAGGIGKKNLMRVQKNPAVAVCDCSSKPGSTYGTSGLFSASIQGVPATTVAPSPLIVQLRFKFLVVKHEQGRVNSIF